jgi:tyrosyl-tRNA synthetase
MAKIVTDEKKIDELLTRGVAEVIEKDHLKKALLSGRKLRVKLGIDPTSPNIHIGRAVQLWKLRAFQDLGHTVVFIVGDFTGLIGDASDKESERPMLSPLEVKQNMKTYFAQAFKILNKSKTEAHYNSKWLKKLGLGEIGKLADLFGLHEFEARENVAKRMAAGKRVSLREIIYPLMQGYDSVAVEADVEIGGTDQKFNLLAGRTIERHYNLEPQDILMTELLEGTDGRKMSSSWGNVINITDSRQDMFAKIMSIEDRLMERYFVLATNIPQSEIPEMLRQNPRDAKMRLAQEIVSMYHGAEAGGEAAEEFIRVFSNKEKPEHIPRAAIGVSEINLTDLLVAAKLAASKSEARRLIEQGAVRINDEKKTDPMEIILLKSEALLQVGPRRFVKVLR